MTLERGDALPPESIRPESTGRDADREARPPHAPAAGPERAVWTAERLRIRARALLREPLAASSPIPSFRGDHDLNPDLAPRPAGATPAELSAAPILADPVLAKPAAVLVPIVMRPHGATLLLTLRAAHLSAHAGQVAFPGGRMEANDAGPAEAALREAEEEIGLDARFAEPLGFLDPYLTGTGYRITPFVALVRPGFSLRLDPAEVADAFEIPLDHALDPRRHERRTRTWRGVERHFFAIAGTTPEVWGATAGIIRTLYERLSGGEG